MVHDRQTERWPKVLLAFLVAAGLGLFVFQFQRERRPEWRNVQIDLAVKSLHHPRLGMIIDVQDDCTGQLDRCLTCHVGKDSSFVLPDGTKSNLFTDPHPAKIAAHFERHRGCSACHGGQGRALVSEIAHRQPKESDRAANRLYLQAACTRCHVPGAAGTEMVAKGAVLYLELGCQMCHPLDKKNLSGWDFGPKLDRPGLRHVSRLRQNIIEPSADFAQSTMPAFAEYFKGREELLQNLLAFLLALSQQPAVCQGPRQRADFLAGENCTLCHQGAQKPSGPPHRCLYIKHRAQELRCSGCHQETPAAKTEPGACVLQSHRPHCQACHLKEAR